MASDADNAKNAVIFTIAFKCRLTQSPEAPNITKDIKFDVQLPWNNKQQIPLLSKWDTKQYAFDVNIEFTKAKIIEWSENGIMSIKPTLNTKTVDDKGKSKEENKEYDTMKVHLSSLLNGSTSFNTKLEHKQLLSMEYLDVSIKLNQAIMTESWSKQLIPFDFEICYIEDLPIPFDCTTTTYKPLTISYNLPGLSETVISPSFAIDYGKIYENKQKNQAQKRLSIETVKINFRKTYLLATQLDDLHEFLHKIRYDPVKIQVHSQDFDAPTEDGINWHIHGQCDAVLNDVFDSKCISEQTQPCYSIFQNDDKCKSNFQRMDAYRKHFTNLTVRYQLLAPTKHLLSLLDGSSLFVRAVYRLHCSDFDSYSNIMQYVTDCNVDELQLQQIEEQIVDEPAKNDADKSAENEADTVEETESAKQPIPELLSKEQLLQNAEVSDDQMSSLDLLTGFEIIQNDHRLIVIEGKRDGPRMQGLFDKTLTEQRHFLIDPSIHFQHRLYSEFHHIYKLKLNTSLQDTINDKHFYIGLSKKDNQNIHTLYQKLFDLTNCTSMETARNRNIFPSSSDLKYLETANHAQIVTPQIEEAIKENMKHTVIDPNVFELIDENFIIKPEPIKEIKFKKQRIPISTIWKKTSDSKLNSLKSDTSEQCTDFIKKHILSYTADPEIMKQRRIEKQKILDTVPDIIVDKDRRNEVENGKNEKIKSFVTPDGWQFYKPKQPEEFTKHQNKPHPARCDELKSAWCQYRADQGRKSVQTQNAEDNRPDFNQFTDTQSRLFGMKGNEQFWQSVFCSNEDEQILFVQQETEKQLTEWSDKVVVDDVVFRVNMQSKTDAVHIIDKFKDVMQDEPMKEALKYKKKNPKWSIFRNECSQSVQWKFNESELENRKTITRTELEPAKYLSGEFDHIHITKPQALFSKRDNLSRQPSRAFSKITKNEILSNSKLYGTVNKSE